MTRHLDNMDRLSSDSLMDIAAQAIRPDFNARLRANRARSILKARIRTGDVNDMDHARAEALGLI